MKGRAVSCLLLLSVSCSTAFAVTLSGPESVDNVMAAMTPEEKAKIVSGTGMNNAEHVPGAAGSTFAIPRLGVVQTVMADGPIGVRLGAGPTGGEKRYSTAFPIASAMAATWNNSLIYQLAEAIGREAKARGVDIMLGPALNIQRTPLNGRNFEYYSEDPFLSGHIAAAYIKGMQSTGIGATVKHFIANNQETRRQYIDEIIPERALNEIYLSGFEYAIKEGKPWAVMSAYPSINGEAASQNKTLLTTLLRNKWGYDGVVMSDWYGVKDPTKALLAGNDLIMPGGPQDERGPFESGASTPDAAVLAALQSGQLTQQAIDTNVRRILTLITKTAAFHGNQPTEAPLTDNTPVARTVATESMVLLKNQDHALPLNTAQKIAVFGKAAHNFYISGGGSAEVNVDPRRVVYPLPALEQAGFTVLDSLDGHPLDERSAPAQLSHAADTADVALIFIGRTSTEGADRYTMALHPDEVALIQRTAKLFHERQKKAIVILNVGAVVDMKAWNDHPDAILLSWLPGQEAGHALADLLSGKISPSGKLPFTIPVNYRDNPSWGNFPGNQQRVIYGEGIYVGYRYYDTKGIAPLYPFGHGLSYSSFTYGPLQLSTTRLDQDNFAPLTVTVPVKNTGPVPAMEVVQVYVRDVHSRLDRPFQELKNYRKILLQPGEEKRVTFTLDARAFSFWDDNQHNWTIEPGLFEIRVGSSSRDIRQQAQLRLVSQQHPALSLDTPWLVIQQYEDAARIVARYLGEEEVNAWISGNPTLGDKLKAFFSKQTDLAQDVTKQQQMQQQIITELNQL